MREMVLNHASLASPDRHTAVGWLKDVTVGMTMLVRDNIVELSLRMRQSPSETLCLPNWSLWDTLLEMRKGGAREEFAFFSRLSSKVPLLSDVDRDIADRFRGCEAETLPPENGEPLVLCAITDGIAIGFPAESIWDCDQLTIRFIEMLPDGSIGKRLNRPTISRGPPMLNRSVDDIAQSFAANSQISSHCGRTKNRRFQTSFLVRMWNASSRD